MHIRRWKLRTNSRGSDYIVNSREDLLSSVYAAYIETRRRRLEIKRSGYTDFPLDSGVFFYIHTSDEIQNIHRVERLYMCMWMLVFTYSISINIKIKTPNIKKYMYVRVLIFVKVNMWKVIRRIQSFNLLLTEIDSEISFAKIKNKRNNRCS